MPRGLGAAPLWASFALHLDLLVGRGVSRCRVVVMEVVLLVAVVVVVVVVVALGTSS